MRLTALAAAFLLLGATGAWAQSSNSNPFQNQSQQSGSGGGSGNGTGSSALSGSASNSVNTAVAASRQGSGNAPSSNPLAGATSATPTVSTGVPATQNGSVQGFMNTTDGLSIPVFGTNVFTGSFAGTRPGDQPDYVIQPGDSVIVNLYGAVNIGGSETVDATGNIFVTGVGPIHVGGVKGSALQGTVAAAVGRVFTGAVGIYATMNQAGSIGVFVSGNVPRPGRYLGGARDSVLFFLSQAGGVDAWRGSMRNITVHRNGQTIATYDLYDFLLSGRLNDMRFQEGDTIFVAPRGAMVGVTGAVRNPYAFEAPSASRTMTGADLVPLARLEPTVTGAALHGYRDSEPRTAYFPLTDFSRVLLADGDHVEFRSDAFNGSVTVSIKGEVKGQSVYVLPRGSTLGQLMAQIPLDGTDIEPRWVHVQRQEVAQEQKKAIQDALFNLQKQALTSAPATNTAAQLATAQATLITQFVAQAQTVQPDGNIAVYSNGQFHDLRLQDGDLVILPNRTDVVIVAGEVLSPGGLTHADNRTIEGYVSLAGGYASHANRKHFVLQHRDGSAIVARPGDKPLPGDELIVLPQIGDEKLQMFMDLSQLFFQLALSAATVISVTKGL
jgi:protein involved in polysaccharide export with SLBB domain